jgi:site-specific DNA-adenine methylase
MQSDMPLPFHILRSPGSKCWFVPLAQRFLHHHPRPKTIVEPFGGSAVVGLTLLDRGFGQRLVLGEKDSALRTFWETAVGDPRFSGRVFGWKLDAWAQPPEKQAEFVAESLAQMEQTDPAFFVLLRSLVAFNGILQGRFAIRKIRPIRSWLPVTLDSSLEFLYAIRHKIEVLSDGFNALERMDKPDTYAFVDPPYTSGKDSPGHKLYGESEINYKELLHQLAHSRGSWQFTSEYCPEMLTLLERACSVLEPIQKYAVPMRTGHGRTKVELVVCRGPSNRGKAPSKPHQEPELPDRSDGCRRQQQDPQNSDSDSMPEVNKNKEEPEFR